MIAKFDLITQDRIRRIRNSQIHYYYIGHKIQNESYLFWPSKQNIFFVILDCTPDVNHQEQMTLIIRCENKSNNKIKIEEYFLEYLKLKSEAGNSVNVIESFKFLFGMIIWYDILFSINMVSKKLQSKSINEGFTSSMDVTKSVALEMDVEPILSTKYLVIRKNQFDKNNQDEEIQSVAKSFRVNYFLVVIDMTITSLKNIFEQLKTFEIDRRDVKGINDEGWCRS
ncbi:hypothetical protein GmHk_17G049838 [Glycine max]|nr:hypothetical protein GmHk_17G049838 [Glycine max]